MADDSASNSDSSAASSPGSPNANADSTLGSISLDAIVRATDSNSVAGAPVPATEPSKEATRPSSDAVTGTPNANASVIVPSLDDILAIEDPGFVASMAELKSVPTDSDSAEVDSLDLNALRAEEKKTASHFWRILRHPRASFLAAKRGLAEMRRKGLTPLLLQLVRVAIQSSQKILLGGGKTSVGLLKDGLKKFTQLPKTSKFLLLAVVALGCALFFVLQLTFKGAFLPDLKTPFLNEFESIANAAYTYRPDAAMEDFQNPLLHPEAIVLIDRMVVNLRHDNDDANPMGMFEFYIEMSNREAAIELKQRLVEARDVISRTLEQVSYPEMSTNSGKKKLKVVLRKNLNEFLTKGRVRRIFFKTMILKP